MEKYFYFFSFFLLSITGYFMRNSLFAQTSEGYDNPCETYCKPDDAYTCFIHWPNGTTSHCEDHRKK